MILFYKVCFILIYIYVCRFSWINFIFKSERYKILKAEIGQAQGKPGEVLSDHLEISCGNKKSIKIKEIQRQGKKPQSIGEFVLGTQIKKGSFL